MAPGPTLFLLSAVRYYAHMSVLSPFSPGLISVARSGRVTSLPLLFFFFLPLFTKAGRNRRHLPYSDFVSFNKLAFAIAISVLFILYNGGFFMGPMLVPPPIRFADGGSTTRTSASGVLHGGTGSRILPSDNPFSGFKAPFLRGLGYLYDDIVNPRPSDIQSFVDGLSLGAKRLGLTPGLSPGSGSGSSGFYPSPSAQQLDYFAADLAKRYGMDRTTAYNEAMANTAYQRAVADMQAAGLNPASLFSAGRASVAGSGYASGGHSGGYSSARGAAQDDQLPGWLYYGVTALVQAVGTAATKSPYAGFAMSQIAQNLMKAFNGIK